MKKTIQRYMLVLTIFVLLSGVGTAYAAEMIIIKHGQVQAIVDDSTVDMPISPVVQDDSTLVPLRFVVEVLGVQVNWLPTTKTVEINHQDTKAVLVIGDTEALVNGESIQLAVAPEINEGITLVPLRLLETFGWQVSYLEQTHEIKINKSVPSSESDQTEEPVEQEPEPDTNILPIAKFKVNKTTVGMGETVRYTDESYDKDGKIIESRWKGKKRAFFKPGDYEVTVEARDNMGAWSEPCTEVIHVTDELIMDEITYHIKYPIKGEIVSTELINPQELPALEFDAVGKERTLLVSNSPESVTQEGILYHDQVQGKVRLFYHHSNKSAEQMAIYVLAINSGSELVSMVQENWGAAGPRKQVMEVGKMSMMRYFESQCDDPYFIKAGETFFINGEQGVVVRPNEVVNGIYDLDFSEEVDIYFVAVRPETSVTEVLSSLPVLSKNDRHLRGTFENADRELQIKTSSAGRIELVNTEYDKQISGQDVTTGRSVINKGNYGVKYEIKVEHPENTAFFFEAIGGLFSGAMAIDGQRVALPTWGMVRPYEQLVIVGTSSGNNETTELEIIPPGGSSLPVQLIIWPY